MLRLLHRGEIRVCLNMVLFRVNSLITIRYVNLSFFHLLCSVRSFSPLFFFSILFSCYLRWFVSKNTVFSVVIK